MGNDGDYVGLVVAEVKFVLLIRCEHGGGILNLAHPAAANEMAAELQNKIDTLTTNCETKVQHDDSPDCETVPHTFHGLKHENQS